MLISHQKQWDFLKRKFETDQLAHAYLFSGAKQLGKKTFAKEFAEFAGCKFPDLMVVEPKGGEEISIAKIREVQNFLAYKSYNGGFKIVIVGDAHLMNQEAQNCFLKTLEEPKGKTILILVSSKLEMLLPTIFSRCQIVKFLGRPAQNQQEIDKENKILQDVLKIVNLDLAEKFQYAKSLDFEKQNLSQILEILQKYFRNLLLFGPKNAGYPVQKIKEILRLIEEINLKITTTNASPKLALEVMLMEI